MELPSALENLVREGKAILLLGAGASLEAKNSKNTNPPSTKKLSELLSEKFLGGNYKDYPLNQIGEYAISETDLKTVQNYIREIFLDFQPTPTHELLCTFKWACIATTNYDLLIEKAYEKVKNPTQIPATFIENGDRVEDKLEDSRTFMLLKLHGCISRINNPDCPLILTTDQYVEYRKGRSRIFDHLETKAVERPIVFIGHSLQDQNLRSIILELTKSDISRPRYYLVSPDIDDVQKRFWESKKITALDGTFHDFMKTLDNKIPSAFRALTTPVIIDLPISEKFALSNVSLSKNCLQFLESHADYVKSISTQKAYAANFYRGDNQGWAAIEQNLDCRRALVDTILSEHFLSDGLKTKMEMILIKAHAGAGKSICMRRIAWDAARDYNLLCLYIRPSGVINTAAIQELINTCNQRIYLFVDNAIEHIRELKSLSKEIGPEGKRLTVVIADRLNEWNVVGDSISHLITAEYDLSYLAPKEIDSLIDLLTKHKALGTLEGSSKEEKRLAFSQRAGRQILVALHEATLGRPFENILEDEYNKITPHEAQKLYLTICVLNRLDVRIRAGLISHIHGIPFTEFSKRLFKPLENVVKAEYDEHARDYAYGARHPHIAEIVFERILKTQEDRYNEYIRCLKAINIDYSLDRKAFNHMIKARSLIALFPNHELVKSIYEIARSMAGDEAHLYHQMGIYEMNRPNGNLENAYNHLIKAQQIYPNSNYIKHSLAEYHCKMAERSGTTLSQTKYFNEALKICQTLKKQESSDSYSYHTLVKIGVRRLRTLVESGNEDAFAAEFSEILKKTESDLAEGLQHFPGDSYLLTAESELAQFLEQESRALKAMERAFEINQRNSLLATRLASCFIHREELDKAKQILKRALDANRNDKQLHYNFAKLLIDKPDSSPLEITYHLTRSFAPGDKNYDAQILYGRQLFLDGKVDESKEFFKQLNTVEVSLKFKTKPLYPFDKKFSGTIIKIEPYYCFIKRDGYGDWIYTNKNDVTPEIWKQLVLGQKVTFQVAFNFKGATGFTLKIGADVAVMHSRLNLEIA